jgi:phosphoglycerol transferase MdoB-like AlkP superfamily enzyme
VSKIIADYLSTIYVLISLAVIGFSMLIWIFSSWIPSLLEYNYCNLPDKFRELSNKTMLYFVIPFLSFLLLMRGKRPENSIWLIIFAFLSPILYLCLWLVVFPLANKFYTKSEINTYAIVENKSKVSVVKAPDKYYLYLSGVQGIGSCFRKVRVSIDIYKSAKVGSEVVLSIKMGLFNVPYVDEVKLIKKF